MATNTENNHRKSHNGRNTPRMAIRTLAAATLAVIPIMATAQPSRDSLSISCGAWASASTNLRLRPLLSYSNEWGRFTQYDEGEAAACAKVTYRHEFRNPSLTFGAGLSGQVSTDSRRTMLNEAYADFGLWMFDVKAGMENYTPIETNTPTSVGSYLMSNNARPVPRAWVGILDYWALPLDRLPLPFAGRLKSLIEIRGGVSFGRIDDEGEAGYTDNILLSEKFAYGRIGAWPVKPYVGLYHSVVMGGRMSNGTKIPMDFWNSFLCRRGDPDIFGSGEFRGETTNKAGGHQGMWDCGVDFAIGDAATGKLYHQKPFTDSKASGFASHPFDDFTLGAQISLPRFAPISEVSVELAKTDWQGGEGLPDPYVPTSSGQYVLYYPGDINEKNFDRMKNEVFVADDVRDWESRTGRVLTADNYYDFFIDMYNRGGEYGGRSLYLTNYCIEQGWTRGGLSMGNALLHSKETVRRYAPAGTMKLDNTFPNTRVRAVNIGIAGKLIQGRLSYTARATFSRNYGNYRELYKGDSSISWEEWDGYLFATPKNETYTKLDLGFALPHGLSLRANLTYDFGDLYHSFAARAGLKYEIGKSL